MINCTDFQNTIDEYCRADLSPEVTADFDAHLASCSECTRAVDAHNDFLISLKAMPVVGPSEGFAIRALRIAAEPETVGQNVGHYRHNHHRRGFMVGFGSAAVAALALWVVVGVFPQQMPGTNGDSEMAKVEANADTNVKKSIPEFSIALNEQRDIKLAFFSSVDLKGAQITLQLPENVALVGHEGQRELAWNTNLAKGDNTLRLPIVATSVTGGQLVARIEYMGKVKTLKVNLSVGAAHVAPDAVPNVVPDIAPELSGGTGFEMQVG